MEDLEALMEQYADENGCISRDSMRRALEASLGSSVSEADVDRVMSRLGSSEDHGGSRRVSLVEADIAIKAFRKMASPAPSPSMDRGCLDLDDLELAARCDEAEMRAIGAEVALAASEERLMQLMSERDELTTEVEYLKDHRESEVRSSCYAIEELQAELQDAVAEAEQERQARARDARRIELLTAEVEEQKQNAAHAEEQSTRCTQLEAKVAQLLQVSAQNVQLQESLKEVQSENELLVQRVSQQAEQNRGVSEQLSRYQELLNDTQTTLQNQRAIVETLNQAIENKALLPNEQNRQESLAMEMATQHSLAEIDTLSKQISSLSTVLHRQEEERQQQKHEQLLKRDTNNNTDGLGFSTADLMKQLKATIKSELQSELSQMRDVFTPTGTPVSTPKHSTSTSATTKEAPKERTNVQPSALSFSNTVWKPHRELLDLEYQFQDQAEQMTDQAASISNYMSRMQKACDRFGKKLEDSASRDSSLSPRNRSCSLGGHESNFLQSVTKLLVKMKKAEGHMRECLQSLFGEQNGEVEIAREPDIWNRRCMPPLYLLALQKELLSVKTSESNKIERLQREKEEAIERNACEWKRAIRKAAKRINRDPDTPLTINASHLACAEQHQIENIPPALVDKFNIRPLFGVVVEQMAEC